MLRSPVAGTVVDFVVATDVVIAESQSFYQFVLLLQCRIVFCLRIVTRCWAFAPVVTTGVDGERG